MKMVKDFRTYKRSINESVESSNELKSMIDVPEEVFETAKKIAIDNFDRVRRPIFEYDRNEGLILKFFVTESDYRYADDTPLKLDIGEGPRKKREYDVTITMFDKISETFQLFFNVKYEPNDSNKEEDFSGEDDGDIDDDEYYKSDLDFVHPDEEDIDNHINRHVKTRGEFIDPDLDKDVIDLDEEI